MAPCRIPDIDTLTFGETLLGSLPMHRCWYRVTLLTVVLVGIQLASIGLCPCAFCAVVSEGRGSDCPCQCGRPVVSAEVTESKDRRKVANDLPSLVSGDLFGDALLHIPQRVISGQAVARSVSGPFAMLCRFVL